MGSKIVGFIEQTWYEYLELVSSYLPSSIKRIFPSSRKAILITITGVAIIEILIIALGYFYIF